MGTAFRFFLIAISLLETVNFSYADPVGDTAGSQAGVILEAGEIDSSKVEIGAFAVVIHGLGEGHPVSGEWEQLVPARGYIQAVDTEKMILARGREGWPEPIVLDRIQTLVLVGAAYLRAGVWDSTNPTGRIARKVGSFSQGLANQDSTQGSGEIKAVADWGNANSGRAAGDFRETPDSLSGRTAKGKDMGRGRRIVKKLAAGALAGIVPSYALGIILTGTSDAEGFGAGLVFEFSLIFGYPVGAAIGVSLADPHDRFITSMAGGGIGFVIGFMLTAPHNFLIDSRWETWPMFVGPLVGATIASELLREPLESRRLSVGLGPSPRGHLSAVAKLRF